MKMYKWKAQRQRTATGLNPVEYCCYNSLCACGVDWRQVGGIEWSHFVLGEFDLKSLVVQSKATNAEGR